MPGPTTASKKSSEFDPRSIGSCQLWLDASDLSAVTGSSPVSAWRDKSLNTLTSSTTSVTGSPVLTTSAINGLRAILLNGSASLTGSTTGSGTTLTVCIVGTQSNTCAINGGLVCLGRPTYYDWNDVGSLAIAEFTPVGSGLMLSTRNGVNSQIVNTGGTGLVNGSSASPFVYILVNDGTFVNTYLNGTQQSTTNISSTGTFAYTNYVIGSRAGSTAATYWTGYIGEVLIFNSALTSSEINQVQGYLGWKWKTNATMATTNPFFRIRPAIRGLQPIDISIPEYWFDAADSSTITTSSTFLTTWLNKGSLTGSNVTPTTANTATSGTTRVNGNNLINIPSTQRLQFTGSFPTAGRTRFIVTRQTSAGDVTYMFQGGAATTGYDYLGISTNGLIEVAQGVGNRMLSSAIPAQTNLMSLLTFFNSSVAIGSNRVALNGSNVTLATSVVASSYFTGSITTYLSHTGGAGQDIGEFISFNSELSLLQVYMVEGYLAVKWGLQPSLPPTHPFYKISPSTVIPFLPTNLNNCVLWLDGADPAGTGILPSAGVQSSWTDKSTNVWTATQATGGRQPSFVLNSLNGLPGFSFTNASNQSFATAAQTSLNSITGLSIFAVLLPTWASGAAVANPSFFGMRIYNGGVSKINYYVHNNYSATDIYNGASVVYHTSAATTTAIGQNRPFIYSGTNNNGTDLTYPNGSLTADSVAITFGSGTSLPIVVGGDNTDGECWQGYIYEVILYTRVLSTQERQKVEGYLSEKWSLKTVLPATHIYKLFPPAQETLVLITPGTIATVTLSALSGSSGTITWTTSTNATSYRWYVGTTYPTALTSGTVGAVLTTAVSYAFVASTNYIAWVIPVSSTATDGATTQSATASYSSGPAFYSSSSGFIIVGSFNSTGLNLRTLANAAVNTNIQTYTGFTSAWNFVHDKDIDGRVWYGAAEASRSLIKYTVPVGSGAATTVIVGTITNSTSILGACYAPAAMGGASGNTYGAFIIGGFNSANIIIAEFNAAKTAIAFTYNVAYVSEVYGTEVVPAFASGFTLNFGVAYTRGSKQMSSWTINLNTRSWTNRVDNSYVGGSTGPSNGLGMIYYPIGKAMYTGDPNTAVNRISMFDTSNNINRIWSITQSGNALVWTYLTSFTPSGFNGAATGAFVYHLSTNAYNQY